MFTCKVGIYEIIGGFFSVDDEFFNVAASAVDGDIECGIAIFEAFNFFFTFQEHRHKGVELYAVGQECHAGINAKHHRQIACGTAKVGLECAERHTCETVVSTLVAAKQRLCTIHGTQSVAKHGLVVRFCSGKVPECLHHWCHHLA